MNPPYGPPGGVPPYAPGGMPPRPAMYGMPPGPPPGMHGYGTPPGVPMMRPMDANKPKPSTTLYVGSLPESVSDDFVQSLIHACGRARSWKRLTDPETRKMKNFGFAEYQSVEELLRAKAVLGEVEIDGERIALRTSSATDQFVEYYLHMKAQHMRGADGAAGEGLTEEEEEVARTEEARQRVADLLRARGTRTDSRMADQFMASLERGGGDDGRGRQGGRSRSRSPDRWGRDRDRDRDRDRNRDRDRDRDRDRGRGGLPPPPRHASPGPSPREAEAESREWRRRLAAWEKEEQERVRELQRAQKREREAEEDWHRQVKADEADGDSDIGEELWRRAPMAERRGAAERRRRLERERCEDEADALREKEEDERRMREEEEERRRREEQEARERREREAQAQAQAQTQGPPAQEPAQERREEVAAAAHAAESAQASAPPPEPPKAVSIPSDDPILRAMQQAALARPETGGADPEPPKPAPAPAAPMRLQPVKPQWGVRAGGAAAAKRPGGGLQGVFGEEEDSRPKLSAPLPAPASVPSAPAPAPTPAPAGKEALRELASRIPSTWQGLLAYDVDWAAYDGMSGDSRVRQQLLSWVSKKIREYLGADEPSLAEFIMGKVGEHAGPAEMHDFMKDVLDSDTKTFLLKLYRTLIYETLKWKEKAAAAGGAQE